MEVTPAACPYCLGTTLSAWFEDWPRRGFTSPQQRATYHRCRDCQSAVLKPWLSTSELGRWYSDFDAALPPVERPRTGLRRVVRRVFPSLADYPLGVAASSSLLDVGCGDGSKLLPFYRAGWRVAGIEVSPSLAAVARQAMPDGEFLCGDVATSTFSAGAFEYVRLDNVLEHMPDPLAFIQSCRRHLAPAGQLIIHLPAGTGLLLRVLRNRSESAWVPCHIHLPSRAGLLRLLERAGFSHISVSAWSAHSSAASQFKSVIGVPGAIAPLLSRAYCAANRWTGLGDFLTAIASNGR
jgi:SAM-dependent methyltransferase